ncbi:MAG: hypothetical protein IJJ23_07970 [Clostridia bacterium]|nr:hypothetical protein [Clostridia bacterium]
MAGLQQQSMTAPPRAADDLPDRPYFVNEPAEEEEEARPAAASRQKPAPKPAPAPVSPALKAAPTPTYRPAFVPPRPQPAPQKPVRVPAPDISRIRPGAVVTHRAFGKGTVARIETEAGKTYICVTFGQLEKRFGFPGAFEEGFLKLKP